MSSLSVVDPIASSSITNEDDHLIKEILLTHISDDLELDTESLLHVAESIFCSITDNVNDAVSDKYFDLKEPEEPISFIIYKISGEMCFQSFEDENAHKKALDLLEMLGQYAWDAKITIALAALMHVLGSFWLIVQQQFDVALASSLSKIKQLFVTVAKLKLRSKAVNLLVKTMVKVSKLIVRFERGVVCSQHELVDDDVMNVAKPKIYLSTYWIFRGILACASQMMIIDDKNSKSENSDESIIAASHLHSIGNNLISSCSGLEELIDSCHRQIETRLYEKLLSIFNEKQSINQKALEALFSSQGKLPLVNPALQKKFGISELKDKVVLLLITKPDLMLPMHKIFLLLQQTCDNTSNINPQECKSTHTILWVPIRTSFKWSLDDKKIFLFLSSYMPWFSIRNPWSLNSSVVKYIVKEWNFKEDPIMIALDEHGTVANSNALDMVWIWGTKGYPFSASKEKQLWREQQEKSNTDLMFDGVNPLLSEWVEQGKNICIYGSNSIDWIREFNDKLKKVKIAGIELDSMYVGYKKPKEDLKAIIDDIIDQENVSSSLNYSKIDFFWSRLESMKRSLIRCRDRDDETYGSYKSTNTLIELLDANDDGSWAVIIGCGNSTDDAIIKLDAEKIERCFDDDRLFSLWSRNVSSMGLINAIKSVFDLSLDSATTCDHSTEEVFHYEGELVDKAVNCGTCKRPMKKFVLYKCGDIDV